MEKLKILTPCQQTSFEVTEGLTYYEQLCNIVHYLNKVIDSTEGYTQEIENLQNTTIVSPQGTMDVNKVTAENGVITFEIDISNKGEPYALTSTILYFNTDASRPITTDYQTAISVEDKTFYITTTQTRVINGTPTDDKDKKEVVTFSNSFDIYGNQVSISEGGITRDLIADGAVNAQKIADGSIVGYKIADKTLEVNSVSDDFINKLSYRPNLLINGDFQINQRGQASYTFTNVQFQYGIDMWQMSNAVFTVATKELKSNDGVNPCYFFQKMSLEEGTYTISLNIRNLVGTAKLFAQGTDLTGNGQTLVNGINTAVVNGSPEQITIILEGNSSLNIDYIDLFEGGIAYPHVKEDYVIAMLRCRSYFKRYDISAYDLHKIWSTARGGTLTIRIPYDVPFMFFPSVTLQTPASTWYVYDNNSDESFNNETLNVSLTSYKDMLVCNFDKKAGGRFSATGDYSVNDFLVWVSCEPQ